MIKGEDIRNDLRTGMIVRVHQKIKDVNRKGEERERIQMFEGIVIAVKHGKEAGATFTVRKVSNGIGVEKIFPIHSPLVDTVELVREMRVRQAKAGYLRNFKKKLKERRRGPKPAVKAEEPKKEAKAEAPKEDAPVAEEKKEETVAEEAK